MDAHNFANCFGSLAFHRSLSARYNSEAKNLVKNFGFESFGKSIHWSRRKDWSFVLYFQLGSGKFDAQQNTKRSCLNFRSPSTVMHP